MSFGNFYDLTDADLHAWDSFFPGISDTVPLAEKEPAPRVEITDTKIKIIVPETLVKSELTTDPIAEKPKPSKKRKYKEIEEEKKIRRRKQNRDSQRTLRAQKKQLVEDAEAKVESLRSALAEDQIQIAAMQTTNKALKDEIAWDFNLIKPYLHTLLPQSDPSTLSDDPIQGTAQLMQLIKEHPELFPFFEKPLH